MRIAMISTPFIAVPPKHYGGTELAVHELTQGLLARGHHVTLFATGDSADGPYLRSLYPNAQWPPDPLTEVNHVTWALAEVAREPFDLLHVHSAMALGVTRLLLRMPTVYTLHHVSDATLERFYRYFAHVTFVAISHDQSRRIRLSSRPPVVHHGLDPGRYQCHRRPADYVCFLGRYARIKGPHTAIDVARAAGVPIRLAGEVHPPDRDFAAKELAPRLGGPGAIDIGLVGPTAKQKLLAGARALLMPIEWEEPFGLAMIEAMLSGAPPVAFARGSAPELIEQEKTGFLADSVPEMVRLIRPGGAVDRFDRARCRALAIERFGRDRMVTEYESIYRSATRHPDIAPVGRTSLAS